MKKVILSILAVTLVMTVASAKKKTSNVVTLDFANGNPLTAVQGTSPEKVTINTPAYGLTIPTKYVKTLEQALELGYVDCPDPEKGVEGWHFPYSRQSFQSDGKTYEFTLGTAPTKGRKAHLLYHSKYNALFSAKTVFSFPEVDGMVPCGIKIYTIRNSKNVNPRIVFRIAKGAINSKAEITKTTAPEPETDSVLEAQFDDIQKGDNIIAFTYAAFNIAKIEFIYKPLPKASKAGKKR